MTIAPTPKPLDGSSRYERNAASELELPGLLMRRALTVVAVGLLMLLTIAVLRARADTLREMQGSVDLARATQAVVSLGRSPPERALRELRDLGGLRHLELSLLDESGHTLARLADEESDAWILAHGRHLATWLLAPQPAAPVSYTVPLQDGRTWTIVLSASPDSEMQEAASDLLSLLGVAIALIAGLLAAIFWAVRRSLSPLRSIVAAIAGVEQHQLDSVKTLPTMPVRELEAIAQALRHLVAAQELSEAGRRVLAHRIMSLQEDERQKLARDLHDEFGQRLTALRVDANWLQRAGHMDAPAQRVVNGMMEQIVLIQDDVRRLLARLRPMGATPAGVDTGVQTMGRLRSLLEELVQGWTGTRRDSTPKIELRLDSLLDDLVLPQDLSLSLYRITQEALTNVMRHADATSCDISIELQADEAGGRVLVWTVRDNGEGIADLSAALRRGSGLAGLKDRVWTLGGSFECDVGSGGRGTALRAEFRLEDGAAA